MAPHSSTLPGKFHGWRSLVGCSPCGRWESDTTERLHFSLSCIGEGNGNPLQCSCLQSPRDGGAWWLPSVGSHRVGRDWSDLAAAAAVAQTVKTLPAMQETWVQSLGREDPLENSLQYSCLENFMGRGVWQTIVHGVTKIQTWLSD